jgi:hypothetical protein
MASIPFFSAETAITGRGFMGRKNATRGRFYGVLKFAGGENLAASAVQWI